MRKILTIQTAGSMVQVRERLGRSPVEPGSRTRETVMDYLERTVGELVAEDYARAAVFTEFGIDFCCGGGRSTSRACASAGVDPTRLVDALAAVDARGGDGPPADPRSWPLDRLVAHIEDRHHTYVRRTLPVLDAWTAKVARVHGARHPELAEIRGLFQELAEEMTRHLDDEEQVLFPRVAAMGTSADDGEPVADAVVTALEDDHEHAGSTMRRIRELTDGFTPPADACTTYRATFALLREFEQDLHRHVHLEHNVLFPRALEALSASRSPSP